MGVPQLRPEHPTRLTTTLLRDRHGRLRNDDERAQRDAWARDRLGGSDASNW